MDTAEPSTIDEERARDAVCQLVLDSFLRSTRAQSFREFVRRELEGPDGAKKSGKKVSPAGRKKTAPKK